MFSMMFLEFLDQETLVLRNHLAKTRFFKDMMRKIVSSIMKELKEIIWMIMKLITMRK